MLSLNSITVLGFHHYKMLSESKIEEMRILRLHFVYKRKFEIPHKVPMIIGKLSSSPLPNINHRLYEYFHKILVFFIRGVKSAYHLFIHGFLIGPQSNRLYYYSIDQTQVIKKRDFVLHTFII